MRALALLLAAGTALAAGRAPPLHQDLHLQSRQRQHLPASVAAATLADQREVVNFDFSWRHHLGNASGPRPYNCSNGTKGVNFGTGGNEHSGVGSPAACCGICAEEAGCQCWDFNIDNSPGGGYGQCWTKTEGCDHSVPNPLRYSGQVVPGPPAPALPAEAKPTFNDSAWQLVDAPHDMLIVQPYDPAQSEKMGFIARNVGWYRKHFFLPQDWAPPNRARATDGSGGGGGDDADDTGSSVWLYIEGSFHVTTVWVNGVKVTTHVQGYTSFAVRLDDVPNIQFGPDHENVIAVYVDASFGTGWWYEGGGLMRHQYLVRAHPCHLNPTGGAWVHAENISLAADGNSGDGGSATFVVAAEVDNDSAMTAKDVQVRAVVRDASGAVVATGEPGPGAKQDVPAGASRVELAPLAVPVASGVQAWSVQRPYLYTVEVQLLVGGAAVDAVNVTAGVRTIRWDADKGLFLNSEHVKLRGFCDHSSFGGTGAGMPDRVNLFRAQALRAVGGNSWRMAHNPPSPTRLDFMDRLGMLAVDENRDYGGNQGQGGSTTETVAQELVDMADLVRRDRSHPSVMIWSFCNEVGCNNETSAAAFRAVSKQWDPTRAVTQNHDGNYNISGRYLDVQGFSHKQLDVFQSFHSEHPDVPMMATECCSCMSQRGVDEDSCPQPKDGGCEQPPATLPNGTFYNNNIGDCTAQQVAASDYMAEYLTGTFVWSGFDYIGEARGWPQNTKCRGTVSDVAGFTKETAYWLRSWWLSNITATDAGRPANPPAVAPASTGTPAAAAGSADDSVTLFIVDAWTPPPGGAPNRSVHVYTNAASVRLLVNGEPAVGGASQAVPFFGMVSFDAVAFDPGNLTAVAADASGLDIATYSVHTQGSVAGVVVSVDAPAVATGTGSFVVADGEDVALLRASLVDANGLVVHGASNNVTFRVASGPGRIWATHSGSPANLSPNHASWTPAYHGLARVFVRTTEDSATSALHRRRLHEIDAEPAPNVRVLLHEDVGDAYAPADIVVEATVTLDDGSTVSAQATVPVSTDLRWAPREVASRSAFGRIE